MNGISALVNKRGPGELPHSPSTCEDTARSQQSASWKRVLTRTNPAGTLISDVQSPEL